MKKDPEKCEIFIVEGDSAGGSAKSARDRNYQAILPIRGKILNVEKATIDKVLANAEIKTMINAFGCGFSEGYGNDFDITKLRYDKIIIMAYAGYEPEEARTHKPAVVFVDEENKISRVTNYEKHGLLKDMA